MLIGITSKIGITKALKDVKNKLESHASQSLTVRYSSPAGIEDPVKIGYSERHNIWWGLEEGENHYWNFFGVDLPADGAAVTGRCQINMPITGHNGRIAGAFAKDEEGKLFLLHSGKVGGGKPGVGKNTFLDFYFAPPVAVQFDDKQVEYLIIADVNSERFMEQLELFIKQVYKFKDSLSKMLDQSKFRIRIDHELENEEYDLRKRYKLPAKTVIASADHALITNALIKNIKKLGHNITRNRRIDAYIKDRKGRLTHLFEVKSKLCSQSVFTAIGQLYLNGLNHKAKYFFVIEEGIQENLVHDLRKLNIYCITFAWRNKQPAFDNLQLIETSK